MRAAISVLSRIVAISSLFAIAGCPAGPTYIVQQYGGPVRPRETIAVLRVNGKDSVRLATLDNEEMTAPLPSDARLHIEILPGRHSLSVRDANVHGRVSFLAAADKVYRVTIEPDANAHVHEVDRDSDALGADVTEALNATGGGVTP